MGLEHITKRGDFKAAAESGRRFRAFACTVQIKQREPEVADGAQKLRLGLTASRHTGTATERNRIRRRLRAAAEAAYVVAADTALDVVIVARREVLTARFDKLVSDLARSVIEARAKSTSPHLKTTPRQDHAKRR
jgi:ribonuclease P protein component